MLVNSFHLLNFVYPDSSCCRDKVSRAAGRRAVVSVFCSPLRKCTVTSKLRFHYRDSYVIGFYRDGTTCVRLPGLAKNSPTPTQTAPNYTTEPLYAITLFASISPLAPGQVCGRTLPTRVSLASSFFNKSGLWNLCHKPVSYT